MKYPWMPLFWGDFLANTMHLSAHEAGAYLFLIAHAWEHDGLIPDDPIRLARIAHVRRERWQQTWKILENFFEPCSEGSLFMGHRHHRVHAELQRLGKISNNRKASAEQMHRSYGKFAATSTSTTNRESSVVSKQGNGRANSPAASPRPEPTTAWHPRIDEADDYRAPPAKKSDNVLQPIPDKPERTQ